ncbi:hypothetical protein CGRA01v4_14658 [Colletotrichum graminicola]|uniref:Uncharacterized protein n=1 Tax=Colletotrichum graminicola (strain M1.001 / M2 / FGSC 10212) TaxID=645133 RepID=E3QF02_COLGM|nr:uncharacterized protein GLRG_04584 [Colletotrichum graminicola M1.001]EFQ29440.1 hypothetical protein GLRG_04584 [Colletotrichum graminicola M1.001]WDK23366.1 hypothetical protein CGRA01v4_14658 [Colletotrichum graminicola]
MGRPHHMGTDTEQDPVQSYGRPYEPASESYDPFPPRGRSPAIRRHNRSEPAASAAVYDDFQRDPGHREQPMGHRESHKRRKDTGSDAYAPQAELRQDRKSHKNRYYHGDENEAFPSRARSHGRSAREPSNAGHYRSIDDQRNEFDAYAPASRRGRERQHAYHPPRTSDTRRTKYSDFEAEPRQAEMRRSRYADYDDTDPRTSEPRHSRYHEYDAEPREIGRRRSRNTDIEKNRRGGSEATRDRYTDYESGPRPQAHGYAFQERGRFRNDSPDRYERSGGQQRSTRGQSMPRREAIGGTSAASRPRARSAVGYAALGEAAQTAFRVGSQAAMQVRSEPGPWIGEKGTRVATAALGAALVDTFVGHKATGMKGGMRHQALRQACEMGIRNFVVQPTVNTATRRSTSGGGGGRSSGGRSRH